MYDIIIPLTTNKKAIMVDKLKGICPFENKLQTIMAINADYVWFYNSSLRLSHLYKMRIHDVTVGGKLIYEAIVYHSEHEHLTKYDFAIKMLNEGYNIYAVNQQIVDPGMYSIIDLALLLLGEIIPL